VHPVTVQSGSQQRWVSHRTILSAARAKGTHLLVMARGLASQNGIKPHPIDFEPYQ
jgi:hypothetical protein